MAPRSEETTYTRRRFLASSAATAFAAYLGMAGVARAGTSSTNEDTQHPTEDDTMLFARRGENPRGPGSVTGAPNLPAGFTTTFKSRYVNAGGLRQHVVIGGEGPPLLLVHGWPQTWYAWRMLMPALARDYTVIAVDQRGIGLTDKPKTGYDAGTLANDLIALMDALGYERFALVGHDTGFIISYALASDHPDRVDRVALAEIPGPPVMTASPLLFEPEHINNRLWHIPFNRVNDPLTEKLVSGREDIFFGYEFDIQGGTPLPEEVVNYYVRRFSEREALRGSFGLYRAWDATLAQNLDRVTRPLPMPVLAIGGEASWGALVGLSMQPLASDLQSLVIPGSGHWIAEQAPDALLTALTEFLAPYRGATFAAPVARQQAATTAAL
jgi:pimeloyl-ACP methyl ester carboxylesterase